METEVDIVVARQAAEVDRGLTPYVVDIYRVVADGVEISPTAEVGRGLDGELSVLVARTIVVERQFWIYGILQRNLSRSEIAETALLSTDEHSAAVIAVAAHAGLETEERHSVDVLSEVYPPQMLHLVWRSRIESLMVGQRVGSTDDYLVRHYLFARSGAVDSLDDVVNLVLIAVEVEGRGVVIACSIDITCYVNKLLSVVFHDVDVILHALRVDGMTRCTLRRGFPRDVDVIALLVDCHIRGIARHFDTSRYAHR